MTVQRLFSNRVFVVAILIGIATSWSIDKADRSEGVIHGPDHGSPIRLLNLPAFLARTLLGPTGAEHQEWLGRNGSEWMNIGFNLLLYGSVAYWCLKQIRLNTDGTSLAAPQTYKMLRIGAELTAVAMLAIALIVWYDYAAGFKATDPAAPAWFIYSFPFYFVGTVGVLLLTMAVVVIVGRKIAFRVKPT